MSECKSAGIVMRPWFVPAALCVFLVLTYFQSPVCARDLESTVDEMMTEAAERLEQDRESLPGKPKAAALDFAVTAPGSGNRIGGYASSRLEAEMVDRRLFLMAERTHVLAILKEIRLDEIGITNHRGANELGKLAGIDYLFLGHVFVGNGETLAIVRLVDIHSGEIAWMNTQHRSFEDSREHLSETLDKFLWIMAAREASERAVEDLFSNEIDPAVQSIGIGSLRNMSGYGYGGFEDFSTDVITAALFSRAPEITIVERQYLDDIFKEKAFMNSGMIDLKDIQSKTQLMSIGALLTGDIKIVQTGMQMDIYGKKMNVEVEAIVNLKLIDVANGFQLANGKGTAKLRN